MKIPQERHWSIPVGIELTEIKALLEKKYKVSVESGEPQLCQLYDDCDWTIWYSGAVVLERSGKRWEFHNKKIQESCYIKDSQARFWWHFPEGKFRSLLKQCTKQREITKKKSIVIGCDQISVYRDDDRLVAKLQYCYVTDAHGQLKAKYFSSRSLGTCQKEYNKVIRLIECIFVQERLDFQSPIIILKSLFTEAGLNPPQQNKISFRLDPNERAEGLIRRMAVGILAQAKQQKAGVLADTDTEFLHHYRVNLRKVRSLLSLTKDVFRREGIQPIRKQLSILFSATNHLRDLDVFLHQQDYYRALIPGLYEDGMTELFGLLEKERASAHLSVCTSLGKKSKQDEIVAMTRYLASKGEYATKLSKSPVLEIAREQILKRYKRIVRLSKHINEQSPNRDIHQIRIDCKKLRYLMELFSGLFDEKPCERIIRKLKALQNILGSFNDCSVQQKFLATYRDDNYYSESVVIAVSRLMDVLQEKQDEERKSLIQALDDFSQKNVVVEFNCVFS